MKYEFIKEASKAFSKAIGLGGNKLYNQLERVNGLLKKTPHGTERRKFLMNKAIDIEKSMDKEEKQYWKNK